jgi:hypothetical protein
MGKVAKSDLRPSMGSVSNAELKSQLRGCALSQWCSAVSAAEKVVAHLIHDHRRAHLLTA